MTEPLPTTSHSHEKEQLTGIIERVTYHNAENGFCVLRVKVKGHRDLITVVVMQPPSAQVNMFMGWDYGSMTRTTAFSLRHPFLRLCLPPP